MYARCYIKKNNVIKYTSLICLYVKNKTKKQQQTKNTLKYLEQCKNNLPLLFAVVNDVSTTFISSWLVVCPENLVINLSISP